MSTSLRTTALASLRALIATRAASDAARERLQALDPDGSDMWRAIPPAIEDAHCRISRSDGNTLMPTKISWCDETWNPIAGCSIVSPACTNCYAMAMAARIERMGNLRYAGLTQPSKAGPVWTGKIAYAPDAALHMPLRWKKPCRIFVNSMSDLFHDGVEVWKIAQIYGVMIAAHHLRGHIFHWLTKRAERARGVLSDPGFWDEANDFANDEIMARCDPLNRRKDDARATCDEYSPANPPPGIWAGVTAEDETRWIERVPYLRTTPASKRFVSYEPALGSVANCDLDGLDWIIAGGESGPNARPMVIGHARDLMRRCQIAGVPFFMKQLGADPIWEDGAFLNIRHRSGADPSEWPEDLRVQEFPAWTTP